MKRDYDGCLMIGIPAVLFLAAVCVIESGHYGARAYHERDTNDESQRRMGVGTDGEGQDGRDGPIGGCPNAGEVPQSRPDGQAPAPAATRPVSRVPNAAPAVGGCGVVPVGGSERRVFNVSAYCGGSCCCGAFADGITASDKPVTANMGRLVAADAVYPFGTRILIPGYAGGVAVPVLDRGGAIKGNKLDVYFPTHRQALEWGRKTLTCEVYQCQ